MPIGGTTKQNRRFALAWLEAGRGFIGAVHRIAARLDDRYELVAAALSSDRGAKPRRPKSCASRAHMPASKRWLHRNQNVQTESKWSRS